MVILLAQAAFRLYATFSHCVPFLRCFLTFQGETRDVSGIISLVGINIMIQPFSLQHMFLLQHHLGE